MPRIKNPDRLAASFASMSMRELSQLQHALQSARASLTQPHGGLHVPVIRTPRTRTKRTTTQPSFLTALGTVSLAEILSGEISESLVGQTANGKSTGNSFQKSAAQLAGALFDAALKGQRIR